MSHRDPIEALSHGSAAASQAVPAPAWEEGEMPSAGAGIASPAGAWGATPSGKQPARGGEEGAAELVSAGPAPCSVVPEACREALGGCSHLCEPHPAGPRWAGNAPSRSSLPAQPRLQRHRRRDPAGCKPHGAGRGTRSSPGAGRPNNMPPSCGKLQCLFF